QPFFAQYKPLLFGMLTLALLTPLGLIATGTAWGECSKEELFERIGFIPKVLEKVTTIWKAWMPDYTMPYLQGSLGYVVSAFVGMLCIAIVTYITSKIVVREHKGHYDTE
ncbi:MAG: PDGLE domain-containing protein, partial [Hyphomonadaceae bacterium]|nr:PDGLE domain-containing protein [Clostridia bacterium]